MPPRKSSRLPVEGITLANAAAFEDFGSVPARSIRRIAANLNKEARANLAAGRTGTPVRSGKTWAPVNPVVSGRTRCDVPNVTNLPRKS